MNQDDILKWINKQVSVASEVMVQLSYRSQLMPPSPAEMLESSLLQKDIDVLKELERVVINWYSSASCPNKTVPVKWVDSCVTDLERQLDNIIPGSESCGYTVILKEFLTWMLERSGVNVISN